MASIDTYSDDDEDKLKDPSVAGSSQVVGGASNTAAQGASSNSKSSGRFQNLQDYLSANQGSGFGEQFADKLNKDTSGAGQVIDSAANQFKQRSDEGSVNYDDSFVKGALSGPQGTGSISGSSGDLKPMNAADFIKSSDNVKRFTQMRDAEYKGPQDFQSTADIYNQAAGATQKAADTAKASRSEGGRFALLDNYFGKPSYSQGQKNLDQYLVQGNDTAMNATKQAAENANLARQQLTNTTKDLGAYAAANAKETQDTRKSVRDQLGIDDAGNILAQDKGQGAIQKGLNDLDAKLAAAIGGKSKTAGDLRSGLSNKNLTTEQLNAFGLDPYQRVYNVNPLDFISEAADPNRSEVASSEQRDYLKALESLAGRQSPELIDYNAAEFNPATAVKFDKNTFNERVGGAEAEYNNALNNVKLPVETLKKLGLNDNPMYTQMKLQDSINVLQNEIGKNPSNTTAVNLLNEYLKLKDKTNQDYGYYNELNYTDKDRPTLAQAQQQANITSNVPVSTGVNNSASNNWGTTISRRRT